MSILNETNVRNLSGVRNFIAGLGSMTSPATREHLHNLDAIINPAVESLVAQKRAELEGLRSSLRGEKVASAPVTPAADTFIEFDDFHSSNVDAIYFNPARRLTRVKFTNGNIYDYANVPETTVREVVTASSVGSAFNRLIKGRFVSTRRRELED